MNQDDLVDLWKKEAPMYEAWGRFILSQVIKKLEEDNININYFLKIPPKERVKETKSLTDKAFSRGKNYSDPYNDIEDKVGIRFVVLLTSEISKITDILSNNENWTCITARDYEIEKEEEPLIFAYQSVHCILRSNKDISFENITIRNNTPCEVQIRTILQHAHAELTHDAIYKSQRKIVPSVHRTVAKCMALIETTDSFFCEATKNLEENSMKYKSVISQLDQIYFKYLEKAPQNQKSTNIILSELEDLLPENLVDLRSEIETILEEKKFLISKINKNSSKYQLYEQSSILYVFWLLEHKRAIISNRWPLEKAILLRAATDSGINIQD